MSLVNDLLIEIDRQREHPESARTRSLSGMAPRRASRMKRVAFAPIALFVTGMLLFASAAVLVLSETTFPGIGTRLPQARPAVSARPIEDAPIVRPASTQSTQSTLETQTTIPAVPTTTAETKIALRPIAIQSVSISRDAQTTRIRITADESTQYRIERTDHPLEVGIILESASLESPIADLKMLGTPIRTIRAHSDSNDLRLALALDENVRIQSQWIWQDYGAVLVIDLQDSGKFRVESDEPLEQTAKVDVAADATRGAQTGQTELITSEQPLAIARSKGDLRRHEQRTLRDQAHRILEAARIARSQGKVQEAIGLYESASQTLPNYREAILEWAALLSESNQVREAVGLVRNARQQSPNDFGMTMLHATIIAEVGDLQSAIRILDQAGHSLTEAPDVHALAAAFLQQKGEHALAIERYETILRRYPGEARWWMGLGISLEATRKTAEALDVYRIAVQLGELPNKARQWVTGRVTALGEEV